MPFCDLADERVSVLQTSENVMGAIRRAYVWFQRIFQAGPWSRGGGLFLEQLEDRCFLSAVPINEVSSAAPDLASSQTEPAELPSSDNATSAEVGAETTEVGNVMRLIHEEIPAWAAARIAIEEGQFLEAFQVNGNTYVVHYRNSFGNSELLFDDSAVVQEVSLVDVLTHRLNRQVSGQLPENQPRLISIDDLEVTYRRVGDADITVIEGILTSISAFDAVQRGFRLTINSSSQQTIPSLPFATRVPQGRADFSGFPDLEMPSTVQAIRDFVGPHKELDELRPLPSFTDRLRLEFWIPPVEFDWEPDEDKEEPDESTVPVPPAFAPDVPRQEFDQDADQLPEVEDETTRAEEEPKTDEELGALKSDSEDPIETELPDEAEPIEENENRRLPPDPKSSQQKRSPHVEHRTPFVPQEEENEGADQRTKRTLNERKTKVLRWSAAAYDDFYARHARNGHSSDPIIDNFHAQPQPASSTPDRARSEAESDEVDAGQ